MKTSGNKTYTIKFLKNVIEKEIPALPAKIKLMVQEAIKKRLTVDPFNLGKLIDKIKEELKKYPEEYKKWEEAGFDVDYLFEIKDDTLIAYDRFTLLHLAVLCGYEKIVNLLIENDASVDVEYKGMTPLHFAVREGHTEIVEILVKNGAKVDAKANVEGFKGYTPLHCAGERGHTKIAKILIANRANVNAKADHLEKTKGITPLQEVEEEQGITGNEQKA